jgi:hypothetical protein
METAYTNIETIYDTPPWEEKEELPKTITLAARTRVNKKTLSTRNPATIVDDVRTKLAKKLMHDLLQSSILKLESVTNPKNGSVTFTASLEAVANNDANKA